MEYSSLSLSESQQQQQQQQYDPSQPQAYDPTQSQPYYHPYQPPASHQQPYPYYQPDDPNPNPHADAAPPGTSQIPAALAAEQPQQEQQPASSGLDNVVAAVTMDETDVAMQERLWHGGHFNAGRPPYRRGGRRGGGPYRGGGRFGYWPPARPDGGFPFRGRGRMARGGGRRFPPHAATAAASSPSQHPGPISAVEQSPPSLPAPAAALASKPSKAPRQPPQVFWCEICMVECNTLEILEQHKNGKRHKKTLQRYEELQKLKKAQSESQDMATVQPENIHGIDENKIALEPKDSAPESSLAVAGMDENKMDIQQQNQTAEQPEVANVDSTEAPGRKRVIESWGYPPKQKRKFGRGGKHLRPSEAAHNSEAPKEQPSRYCALCNVTCDTQAVFEVHLAGKKHTSRAKRFPVPQGGYGAMGPHSFYMPHVQGMGFNPQGPPADNNGNHQAQQAVLGTQVQYGLEYQGQEITPRPEGTAVTVATQYNPVPTWENTISGVGYVPEYGAPFADTVVLPGA
ncbi:hypothetical protein AAC387_Pa01g3194 [Persea americana]